MIDNINNLWVSLDNGTNNPSTPEEKLIWDCFKYKIFYLKPTKKHKEWFKECFNIDYPTVYSELSKSTIRDLKKVIKSRKEQEVFENKMKRQRYNRGYADVDVWNWNNYFADQTSKIFKQLAKNCMGHPLIDENGKHIASSFDYEKDYDSEAIHQVWTDILERISFLAGELNEDTCSLKEEHNKLFNEWYTFHEKFREEYGDGSSLKTEKELKHEKEHNVKVMVFPDRHPDKEFRKNYNIAWNNLRKFEKDLFKYQNKCKNELFDLLKKYYWDLWD